MKKKKNEKKEWRSENKRKWNEKEKGGIRMDQEDENNETFFSNKMKNHSNNC